MSRPFTPFSIVAGMALALMLSAVPLAASPLGAIIAAGVLRVGMTGDYPPFSSRDEKGKFTGADVTMAHDLAKTLNVRLEIVPTSWQRLEGDLQKDRFDVAMSGVSVTPDRAAVGDFSAPVLQDGKRPIVRCADKDRYNSTASIDQPGVRVLVNPGGTNERFAKTNFAHATLVEHEDNRTMFDELAAGHADVIVTDGAEVDYQARLHPGILCPAAVAGPFDRIEKAYWMTRDPALKGAVDHWLERSLRSGAYQKALAAAAHRSS